MDNTALVHEVKLRIIFLWLALEVLKCVFLTVITPSHDSHSNNYRDCTHLLSGSSLADLFSVSSLSASNDALSLSKSSLKSSSPRLSTERY